MNPDSTPDRGLVLDVSAARALATPGEGGELTRALRAHWHRRELVRLARIRNRLLAEAPALAAATGFETAFAYLRASSPAIQHHILSHPSATLWTHVASDLLRRGAHTRFPELHATTHVESFTRLAMSAASLRADTQTAWQVRADRDGRVSLPGASVCWTGGSTAARRIVTLSAGGDATEPSWRHVPRVGRACDFDPWDETLRMEGRTAFSSPELTDADVIAWTAPLDQAWEWIDAAIPAVATEMHEGVRAIVPVHPTSPGAHASATFREAPGLIALSRSTDAGVLAEALVHEYHHTKLNSILNADPLILGPHARAAFYSPWRDDPRPLLGLLHGAYTFQAILAFWCAFVDAGLETLTQERIHQRMHIIGRQTLTATATLREQAHFSDFGQTLVSTIEDNVRALVPRTPVIDAATLQRLVARQDAHRDAWTQTHARDAARMAEGRAAMPATSPLPPLLAELQRDLALPHAGTGAHALATLPEQVLQALLDPHRATIAASWTDRLQKLEPGREPVEDLCAGHAAYVRGDFGRAAACYLHAAHQAPTHPEAWQLASHALRRLGRGDDARRILAAIDAGLLPRTARHASPGAALETLLATLAEVR